MNFLNPYTGGAGAVAQDAIRTALPVEGLKVRVVPLAHLIAFKIYAGGPEALADVMQLLARNPDADRAAIRAVCDRLGLATAFDRLAAAVPPPR